MIVAILGSRAFEYVRPMAEALERVFREVGVSAVVFNDGHAQRAGVQPGLRQYTQGGIDQEHAHAFHS